MQSLNNRRTVTSFVVGFLLSGAIGLLFFHFFDGATIYRTAWGFIPADLSVPMGTEVTFVNITSALSWPASDIHPSHTVFSEFDARRGLSKHESWSYVFEKRGQWAYHDHLATQFIGVIEVYDEQGNSKPDCEANSDTAACWLSTINRALAEEGVSAAFDSLIEVHQTSPEFAARCHNFAHDIGLKAYLLYGENAEMTPKTSYCNAGYFHGFMEGFIRSVDDVAAAEELCLRFQAEIGEEFPYAEKQCRHGIGHGLLEHFIITRPDLLSQPADLVHEAVNICDSINDTFDHKMRCASGAFNVYRDFIVLNDDYQAYVEKDNLFAVCRETTTNYAKEGCYWELAKVLAGPETLETLLTDIRDTGTSDQYVIDDLITGEDREDGYLEFTTRSWSMLVGKLSVKEYDVDLTISVCDLVPAETKEKCLQGVFEGAFTASEPHLEYQYFDAMCTSPELSAAEQAYCFTEFQKYLTEHYARSDFENQCDIVPANRRVDSICPALFSEAE